MIAFIFVGFNLTVHFKSIAPELAQASRFYGVYSRVARKLGVTPQHVRQVALGLHTSRRVSAALKRELRRIGEVLSERAA